MPKCFVIMPLTTPNEYIEKYRDAEHFHHVFTYLFAPALSQAGYDAISPLSVGSELIHAGIIQNLERCDLVLCDISNHNPNVFFELGIRTSLDKPMVLVKDNDTTTIPFDTGSINTFTYSSALGQWQLEREVPRLTEHIRQTVEKSEGKNALWRFFGLTQRGQPAQVDNPLEAKIDLIMTEIDRLKNSVRNSTSYAYNFTPASAVYGTTIVNDPNAQYYGSIPVYSTTNVLAQPPLTALENSPISHQRFAKQAQAIAAREATGALNVRGYDPALNALILDSGNWPFSMATIRQIAAVAQALGVDFQLKTGK